MGCLTRDYWLSKSALGETAKHWHHPGETFTVVNHMATKPWLDVEDFLTGFCIAVVDLKLKITPAIVQASLTRVRADIRRDESFKRKLAVWREIQGIDSKWPSVLNLQQCEEIEALPDPAAGDDTGNGSNIIEGEDRE
jgi:hypothetical protein